jgi:hypothetical protein
MNREVRRLTLTDDGILVGMKPDAASYFPGVYQMGEV